MGGIGLSLTQSTPSICPLLVTKDGFSDFLERGKIFTTWRGSLEVSGAYIYWGFVSLGVGDWKNLGILQFFFGQKF